MRKLPFIITILITAFSLSCNAKIFSKQEEPSKNKAQKTITIKKLPLKKTLYYSGKILPHTKTPVASPVEGLIKKQFLDMGKI